MQWHHGDQTYTAHESAWRRLPAALLAVLAAASIAFVISPFDATVRGDIGVSVLERTFSATSTGLAVMAATVVIDGLCALFVALGLWANPSWSLRLDRWVTRLLVPKKRQPKQPSQTKKSGRDTAGSQPSSTASDVSLAIGVGAGAVLLKYPRAEARKWLELAARYTALNAVVFGIVGYLVAGGANWMADLGFGWLRDGIIRWVPEPLVWTAVFALTVVAPFLWGEWLDHRGLAEDPTPTPG